MRSLLKQKRIRSFIEPVACAYLDPESCDSGVRLQLCCISDTNVLFLYVVKLYPIFVYRLESPIQREFMTPNGK